MSRALQADVVVVGAGLAGLVAADDLVARGQEVVVLEARERVGGRTLNADLGDGKVVELGGQWLGPTQDRVAALARELGIGTFPSHTEGENLLDLDGRQRRYKGTIPRLAPHVLLDLELARRRLGWMARRVSPEAPWEARGAAKLDSQTLGSWLARHARTNQARKLVALAGKTVWGAEPGELSLLQVLFYMRSAGSFDMLLDVEGGAQQDRFVGGSQLLSIKLAEKLGDRVLLEAPVSRIEHDPERVSAHAGENRVEARKAIVAIPPHLGGRIEFAPALPVWKQGLLGRTPMGALAKCMAVYPEPFWRADGLSGEAVSDAGPATLTFDNSPRDGSPGVLLGFVGGADARAYASTPADERRAAVLRTFARLFGERAARPERYLEQSWVEEPWSGGGPVALPAWGAATVHRHSLREPTGAIHWAGAETAVRWCGYLDGAVESGHRTAAEA